jgi:hypothetical protein
MSIPLLLQAGINNISIVATNTCGTDSEVREIRYEPCGIPQVIYNMAPSGLTTNQLIFTYDAQIVNYSPNMIVTLSMNGVLLTGYSNTSGNILAEVGFQPGLNNLTITVTNDCGTLTDVYLATLDSTGGQGIMTNPNGNKQSEGKQDNFSTPSNFKTPKPTPTPIAPKPAAPKPVAPRPATTPAPTTPKPAAPKPTSTPIAPKPAAPKPTTKPAPTTPKPAAPKPTTTPAPTTPKPAAPRPATTPAPTTPKPAAPKPTTSEPAPKPQKTNENTNVKGGGR